MAAADLPTSWIARLRALSTDRVSVLAALFSLGAALAHTHLAVSLELSVSLSYHGSFVRSVLLFVYPLGVSVVGVGAVLERRVAARAAGARVPLVAARLAGLALLVFFAVALRVNFFVTATGELVTAGVANTAALAVWFLFIGVAVAGLLRRARGLDERFVARAWAAHLTGLLVGYATADFLVYSVGVNAMLVCVGVALAIAPRLFVPVAAALLALSAAVGADARIEALRDLDPLMAGNVGRVEAGVHKEYKWRYAEMAGADLVFVGWSRDGQVRLLAERRGDTTVLFGFYNFYLQWRFPRTSPRTKLYRALYSAAGPHDRVVILAAGAGAKAHFFDFVLHPGVVLVELNDAVVRFLRDERPDLNAYTFRRAGVIASEGRHVVETWSEPLDFIFVESGRFRPAWVSDPVGSADTLYTREALATYIRRLRPEGALVVMFSDVRALAEDEYYPLQVLRSLADLGVSYRPLGAVRNKPRWGIDGSGVEIAIVASPTPAGLARALANLPSVVTEDDLLAPTVVDWAPVTASDPRHGRPLTDASPFAGWSAMDDGSRHTLWGVAGALALVLALGAALAGRGSRAALGWHAGPYFFLIGAAQTALQIGTVYAFRTYFGDAVTTTIRVIVWFLVFGAAGSLLAPRLVAARARVGVVALVIAAALLAFHVASFHLIPFTVRHALAREAVAAALLLPGGVLMGLFFPAGLARAADGWVGRLLLADALGTLFGYVAFYLVFLTAGRDVFAATAGVAYLGAVWLLARRATSPAIS